MSAAFASASSQRLSVVPQVTAPPFTVAFWAFPTTTGANKTIWCMGNTGASNNMLRVYQTAGNAWAIEAADAATATATAGVVAASKWFYIVGRFISSTNRRIAVLDPSGTIAHAQNTTSKVPSPAGNLMGFGALIELSFSQFYDGNIAEFWYTNSDIQADGAQLMDATMRQLAFGGPYSVPHIEKDLIEYRSFRSALVSNNDAIGDVDFSSKGIQTWTNTNGVTVGQHPPLPGWYQSPADRNEFIIV